MPAIIGALPPARIIAYLRRALEQHQLVPNCLVPIAYRPDGSIEAVVALLMRRRPKKVDHGDEIEDWEPDRILNGASVGRQHRAFEEHGAKIRVRLSDLFRRRDDFRLDEGGIDRTLLVEDRGLELRLILKALEL